MFLILPLPPPMGVTPVGKGLTGGWGAEDTPHAGLGWGRGRGPQGVLREAACKVEHRTCGEEVCKCQQHRAFLQRSKKTLCSLQIINVHLDITLGGNNLDQKNGFT